MKFLLISFKILDLDAPNSFQNLQSLKSANASVHVVGSGTIMLDFGTESAAWLEMESHDLDLTKVYIKMSVSEYNQPEIVNSGVPFPAKTAIPKKYFGNLFRLELNDQLYEGKNGICGIRYMHFSI